MTKKQVIKILGKNNWNEFLKWMRGQTIGVNPDGSFDYYEHDVKAFVRKLKTGYDSQNDPMVWD